MRRPAGEAAGDSLPGPASGGGVCGGRQGPLPALKPAASALSKGVTQPVDQILPACVGAVRAKCGIVGGIRSTMGTALPDREICGSAQKEEYGQGRQDYSEIRFPCRAEASSWGGIPTFNRA